MERPDTRRVERVAKGFSNHWRAAILFLIAEESGLSVFDISRRLRANYHTTSEHLRRVVAAGLVMKRNRGRRVEHEISPLGEQVAAFLGELFS